MTKSNFFSVLLIISAIMFLPFTTKAQVTIGSTDTPQDFSILELISSGERGFRLPQLTERQRNDMGVQYLTGNDSIAAMGLQIFNTTNFCVETWNGSEWISLCEGDDPDPCARANGVMIAGVCWAKYNLSENNGTDGRGTFVQNIQDYGGLFQWGRSADGHQSRTSERFPGPLSYAVPNSFITTQIFPWDWLTPRNDNLWNSGSESAPQKTSNDPCPSGWRVPTITELNLLRDSGSTWVVNWNNTGINGRVFGSGDNTIFLPAGGGLDSFASLLYVGLAAIFWSSTPDDDVSVRHLFFSDSYVGETWMHRGDGFSVRCVRE